MNFRSSTFRKIASLFLFAALLPACSALNPAASFYTPTPLGTDPLDATLTAVNIIAKKATDGAAMAQTLAAQPTDTPTPTPPAASTPNCESADLSPVARAMGATGSMTFSVFLMNVGNRTCILQGPPHAQIVNMQGIPLQVEVHPVCFNCTPGNGQTPTSPAQEIPAVTQTAAAEAVLTGELGLAPHQAAKIFLVWYNYCEPFPSGGVSVRLNLPPSGYLDVPTDAQTGGRCDASDHPSTLMVSQYSYK